MTRRRHRIDPGHRRYTVDEANSALPLVRAILRDAVDLARDVDSRRRRLAPLLAARSPESSAAPTDLYGEELMEVRQRLEEDVQRLGELRDELTELGVRLVDPLEGHVEFPTRLCDKPGWLSWKLGEDEVRYWRPRQAKSRRRLPMTVGSIAGPKSM